MVTAITYIQMEPILPRYAIYDKSTYFVISLTLPTCKQPIIIFERNIVYELIETIRKLYK